jgi:asparagine synthase (glutamine-hydrolysing)
MDPDSAWCTRLDAAFDRALDQAVAGESPMAVLFSGGVDSSVVAHGAALRGPVRLRSVGTAGAPDLRDAESGAAILGLPWEGTVVGAEAVVRALRRRDLAHWPEPARSVLVSLAVAFAACGPGRILVGQGADELFGGYAHFRGLDPTELEARRKRDWSRLTEVDWPETLALAAELGCDLRAPFLDPGFVREAMDVPLRPVAASEPTKPMLRAWAVHRGVPDALTRRRKRAMQFGSGIERIVRKARTDDEGPENPRSRKDGTLS